MNTISNSTSKVNIFKTYYIHTDRITAYKNLIQKYYDCYYIVYYVTASNYFSLRDIKDCNKSIGRGKIMVEFFSAEIVFRVCR